MRLAAWTAFLLAHSRLMEVLEEELRLAHAMSMAEYDVLHHLAQAPGGRLRMRELADALLYTTSGITRLLDRMTSAGLVLREASSTDRRVVYAEITAKGRSRFREAARTHLAGIQKHFGSSLLDDEVGPVTGFMRRLADPGQH
ncbi:MarR family winged helix-turn-helix transcriptional regulator [Streptomyces microflavus]|uniref:MarR family winged helix-turn-helix transcriptional regulator n=1 Tax=Streptomyces microflavus TaxID=1919 RepID=UPI003828D76A